MTSELSPSRVGPALQSVDLRELSWASRLYCDYCHDYERLRAFFVGAPTSSETWQQVIRGRQDRSGTASPIGDLVTRQLETRGAPDRARAAAARLSDPETVCVVTGQQAGLFGGPLYTLLKALTTIGLARQVSAQHDVVAIPVFWVDAEDHDLAEISTTGVLSDDLTLQEVSVPTPAGAARPAARVQLGDPITSALDQLRTLLPDTEFSTPLFEQLEAIYRPGAGIVEAFARWLDHTLGPEGLVVFDASDPGAKPLVQGIFERELSGRGEASRLAATTGTQLVDLGYHAQVTPVADAVALFHLNDEREPIRLHTESDAFTVGGTPIAATDLMARARTSPESFSPNVLLRPVVQDALFPSVAYVAGPSELAYLAQLRPVYEHFDVPMPVIYPRATATLVDRATVKFLDKHDVTFADLRPQDDGVLNRLLSALLPDTIEQSLGEAERLVDEQLGILAGAVPAVDPTLAGTVDTTTKRIHRDLGTLRNKIVQAAKRRDETMRRQFQRARSLSFPGGTPQERAVGFVYGLNRYGPHLVEQLLRELPLEPGRHWLLTV